MTNTEQRARRRAHNTRALERCNAMGRTAGSTLWQPLENRAGKWFMPDGSELAEVPMEWRSERLSAILDEMDERDAVFPLSDPPPTALEMLKNTQAWETEVNGQWDAGQSRMEMSDYKQKVDAALAARLDIVETHQPGPDGSPYGWTEIALVKTTEPFTPESGKVYRTRVPPRPREEGGALLQSAMQPGKTMSQAAYEALDRPSPLVCTISLEELERAISKPDPMFAEVPEPFRKYRRTNVAEMRPYVPGENIDHVSVSVPDFDAGSPKPGDMIARNPKNHADQWLVAEQYFKDNFEPVE